MCVCTVGICSYPTFCEKDVFFFLMSDGGVKDMAIHFSSFLYPSSETQYGHSETFLYPSDSSVS